MERERLRAKLNGISDVNDEHSTANKPRSTIGNVTKAADEEGEEGEISESD